MKNVLRGFFLAFLATLLGCMLCYTIPDVVSSTAGIYLPIWFYEYQVQKGVGVGGGGGRGGLGVEKWREAGGCGGLQVGIHR